jgi:hypothetical protein
MRLLALGPPCTRESQITGNLLAYRSLSDAMSTMLEFKFN